MKLILDEPESAELATYIRGLSAPPVASALLRVEAIRAVRIGSASAEAVDAARTALAGVTLIALDPATVTWAETVEPAALGALDAIHLVTALDVGAREMIVYDKRLVAAARAHGLAVTSPGA